MARHGRLAKDGGGAVNTGLFSGDGDRLACDEGLVIFLCLTPGTPAIAVLALSERGTGANVRAQVISLKEIAGVGASLCELAPSRRAVGLCA